MANDLGFRIFACKTCGEVLVFIGKTRMYYCINCMTDIPSWEAEDSEKPTCIIRC